MERGHRHAEEARGLVGGVGAVGLEAGGGAGLPELGREVVYAALQGLRRLAYEAAQVVGGEDGDLHGSGGALREAAEDATSPILEQVMSFARNDRLRKVSALAGVALPGRYGKNGGAPGVTIAERQNLGIATVAARKAKAGALKSAVAEAYGVSLPDDSRVAQGAQVSFSGYGPGQWLAVSESLAGEALARDLAKRLESLASISDQHGGRTILRLSGPRARDECE